MRARAKVKPFRSAAVDGSRCAGSGSEPFQPQPESFDRWGTCSACGMTFAGAAEVVPEHRPAPRRPVRELSLTGGIGRAKPGSVFT